MSRTNLKRIMLKVRGQARLASILDASILLSPTAAWDVLLLPRFSPRACKIPSHQEVPGTSNQSVHSILAAFVDICGICMHLSRWFQGQLFCCSLKHRSNELRCTMPGDEFVATFETDQNVPRSLRIE